MESLFWNCRSLLIFPDISNWKTDNLENMKYIFEGCNPIYFPDISRWDISEVKKDIILKESSHIASSSNIRTFSMNTEKENSSNVKSSFISSLTKDEKENKINNTKEEEEI